MDAEISKMTQKILTKQGMKFKLNTKVLSGDSSGESCTLEVEAAKGGKKETVNMDSPLQHRRTLKLDSSMPMLFLLLSVAARIRPV